MVAAVLAIITALISYFASKKGGASDAQAALTAAAVGGGTYYAGTQTEWGKNIVTKIESWLPWTDSAGEAVTDEDGSPIMIPKGAEVVVGADGQPERGPDGSIVWKVVDEAGNVLTNWGGEGTAKVIGTAGAVGLAKNNDWILPAAIVGGVILIAR